MSAFGGKADMAKFEDFHNLQERWGLPPPLRMASRAKDP